MELAFLVTALYLFPSIARVLDELFHASELRAEALAFSRRACSGAHTTPPPVELGFRV